MDYVERMGEDYHRYFDRDPVLRYSDYAALRAIAGYPPVELMPGEYLVHCRAYLEKHLTGYTQPISLGGASLIPGGSMRNTCCKITTRATGRGMSSWCRTRRRRAFWCFTTPMRPRLPSQ